ncbi:MAG: hypothetical protein A2X13_11180 [Bacteroidetes bacterium GWC2_33_15]|nr:MAG: hypothetical protein A2X10_11030 [Bacteroidetes bacterium GWA2_33_15]OFX52607.1 MAG: hypothetical protein A2X13_11180 [Bacteroidetes bacterium GWC2_33_15]OFX63952.1 MAG: hypothetical protein A2X15_03525 [Bacteroidetes bacterium GWB2_32_14]OFX70781.1 MAG: hypothetical protein A2X14_00065 [Bacteroidetes bacterium GWD2_33_33]HAN19909.1 hypothetical protein [Bacteroidales bacterium]
MEIKYLNNNEINFIRWDNCINNAFNGSIFAFSWYLNILCEDWHALVLGDYNYVMPIIHKPVFRKEIIYSHVLGNRLGVFTNNLLTEDIVNQFFNAIPKNYTYIELNLNKFNSFTDCTYQISNHKIYELDLIQSYSALSQKYSGSFQKNIQSAKANKITIVNGLSTNDLIRFSVQKDSKSNPQLNKKEIAQLRMIISFVLRYNLGEIYGAYTANNNLCAVALFIKSKRKIHLLYNAQNKNGKNLNAIYLLIDRFIESHTEKNLTLNIEKVVSENRVEFLTGAGTTEYKTKNIKKNNLPCYYKLLIT